MNTHYWPSVLFVLFNLCHICHILEDGIGAGKISAVSIIATVVTVTRIAFLCKSNIYLFITSFPGEGKPPGRRDSSPAVGDQESEQFSGNC